MKHTNLFPAFAVLIAAPAYAIEAPPDDAPPPAEVAPAAGPDAEPLPAPNEAAEAAYLGVVSGRVPDMLAAHLKLEPGSGIVLQAVMPGSPAAQAGLALHDVITSVDGQPVGTSEDLTARVNAHRPGEVMRIDLIREGKPQQVEAKLDKRPADLAQPQFQPLDQLNLDGIPKDFADRVRRMIEGNLGEPMQGFGNHFNEVPPEIDDAMKELRKRMLDAVEGVPEAKDRNAGGIRIHHGATIRMMDNEGSIEVKSADGGKEITVRDPQGKIVWTGPWDTEQDKAGAPEDIRQRIERLNFDEHGNGLRFHWRGQGFGP